MSPKYDEEWRKDAMCHAVVDVNVLMANAWVDEESDLLELATHLCVEKCEVREQCVSWAASPGSGATGLYGGFFFTNGILKAQHARKLQRELGIVGPTRRRASRSLITNNGQQSGVMA